MKIRVLHAYYGCDTGCCGHIIEIDDEEIGGSFEFGHPESKEELRQFILEHVPKECHANIDWESVECDGFNSCW